MDNVLVERELTTTKTELTNSHKDQKVMSYNQLFVMWLLIFIGYFIFVVQWYSIGNFSKGWGQAFFEGGKQSDLIQSVPNWMITFGRSVGSILAGYWIAKWGHKYAVMFVLGLMVISFPFIIVAQNYDWNGLSIAGGSPQHDGVAVAGFSLFVIFRIFLAVGGTTLISYTNSVIARMPAEKKVKHMTLNQFSFNGGAFFANIFFVIPGFSAAVNNNEAVWTGILSSFVVLALILLIAYYFVADEVVPRKLKTDKFEKANYSLKDAFCEKENWSLYLIYIVWLVSVVFFNSSTIRNFVERSPINALYLVEYNVNNKAMVTSMATSEFYWVWPAFVCCFVSGFVVSIFTITKFSKTVFKRRTYIATMFALGYLFMILSIISGYFGGYGNPAGLAFFLILSFMSGIFLWGAQPVIFTIPQQQEKSNPEYMGVVAGVIWGVGYFGYTIVDASLSSIVTYVDAQNFAALIENATNNAINSKLPDVVKANETAGYITSLVLFFVVLSSVFIIVKFLPDSGYRKDGQFIKFEKAWNPFDFKHINFLNKEYLIENN